MTNDECPTNDEGKTIGFHFVIGGAFVIRHFPKSFGIVPQKTAPTNTLNGTGRPLTILVGTGRGLSGIPCPRPTRPGKRPSTRIKAEEASSAQGVFRDT